MSSHRDVVKPGAGFGTGTSPGFSKARSPLEWIVFGHVAVFVITITWGFGGAADWLLPYFTWWGGLGVVPTFAALQDRTIRSEAWRHLRWWFAPIVVFNVLVLVGCLNPNLRTVHFGSENMLVNSGAKPWWPSSARPQLALEALALFDGIWLSCFNLILVVRRRRTLRSLLLLVVANCLVLAVFGSVQKLTHAKGLFFDSVPSPQIAFFSSFVYHNHWGAFTILMMSACLGLTWHYARRSEPRNFMHSPALAGLVAMFFLAVSIPLSTSRSCTLLAGVLLAAGFIHWFLRLVQKRRRYRESIVLPLAAATAVVLVALIGVWQFAHESILARTPQTQAQIREIISSGSIGSRSILYHDTWRMALDKRWFGWGMASYPYVFWLYNTQTAVDRLPVLYADAHSDWLQALAEYGFVGSTALALSVLGPLISVRRRYLAGILQCYLLGGCALLLLYAWIEFPFGNLAVDLTWWLCFFCALQYARLSSRDSNQSPENTAKTASADHSIA